jgi:cytochrome c551/c552
VRLTFTLATAAAYAAVYAATTFATPAMAGAAEDVMAKAKCNKCHTEKTTKKGTSFADIAAKYKGKPDPTAAMLEMFKTGGKDDHDKVKGSDADLKAVIAFVLAAK